MRGLVQVAFQRRFAQLLRERRVSDGQVHREKVAQRAPHRDRRNVVGLPPEAFVDLRRRYALLAAAFRVPPVAPGEAGNQKLGADVSYVDDAGMPLYAKADEIIEKIQVAVPVVFYVFRSIFTVTLFVCHKLSRHYARAGGCQGAQALYFRPSLVNANIGE